MRAINALMSRLGFVQLKRYGLQLTSEGRVISTRPVALDDGFGSRVVGWEEQDLAALELCQWTTPTPFHRDKPARADTTITERATITSSQITHELDLEIAAGRAALPFDATAVLPAPSADAFDACVVISTKPAPPPPPPPPSPRATPPVPAPPPRTTASLPTVTVPTVAKPPVAASAPAPRVPHVPMPRTTASLPTISKVDPIEPIARGSAPTIPARVLAAALPRAPKATTPPPLGSPNARKRPAAITQSGTIETRDAREQEDEDEDWDWQMAAARARTNADAVDVDDIGAVTVLEIPAPRTRGRTSSRPSPPQPPPRRLAQGTSPNAPLPRLPTIKSH